MTGTNREYIRRRVWTCTAVAVAGWLVLMSSAAFRKNLPDGIPESAVTIAGLLLFAGAMFVVRKLVRCPKCQANLGRTIALPVAFSWGSGPRVNFCPYCGVSLDEPRPGALHSQKPPESLNPIK